MAGLWILCVSFGASANPVYVPGTGAAATSFGVTGFAPGGGAATQYINNNVTGRQDILSNPGSFSSTFFPTIANNTSSSGLVGVPLVFSQAGGGNFNGPFGAATVSSTPTSFGFSISDATVGGGSGSYGVASTISTFTDPVGFVGAIGNFVGINGLLPAVGTDIAVGLRTYITSNNAASPFFGGLDMPELVLGAQRVGAAGYNYTIRGGFGPAGQGTAVIAVGNALVGDIRGLAFNSLNVNIPAGDVFTVYSTLTIFADPASMGSVFDTSEVLDLLPAGEAIPGLLLSATVGPVPEAATLALWLAGLLGIGARGRRLLLSAR